MNNIAIADRKVVIAGLDPAIQQALELLRCRRHGLDRRIEPGDDRGNT